MQFNRRYHALLWTAMKFTCYQLMLMALLVSMARALPVSAQELLKRPVTLTANKQPLGLVLIQIEKAADVRFVYSPQVVRAGQRVSLRAQKQSLATVLEMIFRQTRITWDIVGGQIILKRNSEGQSLNGEPVSDISLSEEATVRTVTGTVTDGKDPLPGVSVVLKGSTRGTTTDATGKFSLSVPDEGATLQFSYIGFLPEEFTLDAAQSIISVSLKTDLRALNEVVVVGYGTQNRRDLTGSVASVTNRNIQDLPVPNIAEGIAGRLPGVLVQQTTGAPGSAPAIKVRGLGSISADNQPLIVLDGQPLNEGALNLINPNDIEKVDVLKDASATAIYGSRGSNGVLMITTKRGKAGQARINFDYYTGVQTVTKKMDVLDSQQFAEFSKDAVNTAYLERVPGATINDPNNVRPPNLRYRYARGEFPGINFDDPANLANYDYQGMIFQHAPVSSYQLSTSGGSDKVQFAVSGNYFKQNGIIKRSGFERYSLRTNLDGQLTNKLKIGASISPSFTIEQRVNSDGHWSENGIINSALALMPFVPIYQADGTTYNGQAAYAATYNWTGVPNPVANISEIDNNVSNLRLLGNVHAELEVAKNFAYRGTFGADIIYLRQNYYQSSALPIFNQLPPTPNNAFAFSSQNLNWITNHTLTYRFTLLSGHQFEVLLGTEAQKNDFQQSQVSANRFANDLIRTVNAGTITGGSSLREQWSLASYFGRLTYSFGEKYLFNASIRRDGSSRFGRNNQWGTFPSASVGWRVSEEPFLKQFSLLSELKLRASYGLSGNNAFGNYAQVSLLNPDNYVLGNSLINGLATSSIGNENLTWEKSRQSNLGVDVGLWRNRLSLTADFYSRITTDLLLRVQVPTLTGFASAVRNIGKVENKGIEFALTTRNLTGQFTWMTELNLSFNRNRVLALGPAGDPIRSGTGVDESNITVLGEPLGNIFGYRQLGIFRNQAELDAYPHFATSRPGDVKYEDINGDGLINADDRTILGNNQPDFTYGLINSFSYRGFDFSVAIQGVQGGQILNLSRRFYDNLEGNANQLTTVLDRWRSPDQPGNGITPRANSRTTGSNNAVSSRWVESASFFRVRNITFGYQVPTKGLERIKVRSLRIYAGAQNAFTVSRYLGYNPEVSGYENALTGGVDYGSYPVGRTVTVGVNIGL